MTKSAYTLEVCTQCVEDMESAIAAGANRFELCGDLSVGGITPDLSQVRKATQICKAYNIPLMVLIRPRGGSFVYSSEEICEMCNSITTMKQAGVDGAVFGALTRHGAIDKLAMEKLISASSGLSRTFHMAFDHIEDSEKLSAIDYLIEQKFDRILTHGSSKPSKIENNLSILNVYVQYAADRIAVMPGGGVHFRNRDHVARFLAVKELHGTRIIDFPHRSL